MGAVQWVWDFGDGSATSADAAPKHTYDAAGIYTVTLSAYNADGCEPDVTTRNVKVESGTGIAAISADQKFTIHSSDDGIVVNNFLNETGELSLYSLDGKLVVKQDLKQGLQLLTISKNTRVFIVVLTTASGVYQQKLIH